MFMHKSIATPVHTKSIEAVGVGFEFEFDSQSLELKCAYVGENTSTFYRFTNAANTSHLIIRTEMSGRVAITYMNDGKQIAKENGDIRWLHVFGDTEFTVEQGMLCEVNSHVVNQYNDPVKVDDKLTYHSRDIVKSLQVLMIGNDGTLICENHKGETITVRKTEMSVASQYDIIWQEVK